MPHYSSERKGHYASIDFELSRRYEGIRHPRIRSARGTEVPPELERGEWSDPFKVDIWALGVLILRACDVSLSIPLLGYVGLTSSCSS